MYHAAWLARENRSYLTSDSNVSEIENPSWLVSIFHCSTATP